MTYTLAVKNTGDSSFTEPLALTDALCQAPPALTSKGGDLTPSTLDPGETWTYTCQVQTQTGQTQVVNEATVRGTDANGHTAEAQDTHTTALTQPVVPVPEPELPAPAQSVAPQVVVAPARVVAGSARLRGPSGCPTTNVVAAVTGRRIVKVTWVLDGKVVGTTRKADGSGRWLGKVRTKSVRYGSHRLQAKVQFAAASRTATRTLSLAFVRCRPAVRTPRFTG